METRTLLRIAGCKAAITLLKGRERSFRHLAQSNRCLDRPLAELELGRIRADIAATYARMRPLAEHA